MNPRPGIKTTEFWMHTILQILLLLNTLSIWSYMPQKYTVIVQGVLGAAYALARGTAKISPPGTTGAPAVIYPVEPPGDGGTEPPA